MKLKNLLLGGIAMASALLIQSASGSAQGPCGLMEYPQDRAACLVTDTTASDTATGIGGNGGG